MYNNLDAITWMLCFHRIIAKVVFVFFNFAEIFLTISKYLIFFFFLSLSLLAVTFVVC